jgi:asparagine synthase (glutamine-hydrolysing)
VCGIAGVFTVERPVDADLVAAVLRMLDAQVHRGPSDWGILLPDEAARDPAVRSLLEPRGWEHVRTYPGSASAPAAVLGNRRLSILDLSPGARMPLGTPDGRAWVSYNGEIYNFRQLRAEIIAHGHSFRTQGDTEALLQGYRAWGDSVVEHLRGMFAFAMLDASVPGQPRLLLARDRLGIKPLYWARYKGVFQIASEVRALVAGGLVPREPEPRGIHGFLVYGSVPTPWTTFRDVLSLPPGHSLIVDELTYSYPRPARYWALPTPGSKPIGREEAVEETRRLLDESVRLHLESDVPLGVFLSGGMDSAALVALAARHVRTPLTTLTVTFDDAELSEGDTAAATARRHGTKHVEVRLRIGDFVAGLERFFDAMDQPTVGGLNTWFVAGAAREAGLTVALSGVGGEELFRGYPGFTRAPRLARLARIPGVPSVLTLVGRVARLAGRHRLEKLEFLREHPILGPYLAVRGLFPPSRAATLLDAGRLPLWAPDEAAPPFTVDTYARLEIARYLEHQLLRDTDVFGMGHSLEIRVPFLDHRLVELALALPLPPEYLAHGDGQKPMLAAAVADGSVSEAAARPQIRFTLPVDKWLREAWPHVERFTATPTTVSHQAFRRAVAAHVSRRIHWSRPWSLAVLQFQCRRGTTPCLRGSSGPRRMLILLPQLMGFGGIPRYNQALLRALTDVFPATEFSAVSMNDQEVPSNHPLACRLQFLGAGPRGRAMHHARFVMYVISTALRKHPDIIVCGHINLMLLAGMVGRLVGAPVSLLAYGIDVWQPRRLLRFAARRATQVVPISRYTASRMKAWGIRSEVMMILPDSVDGEVFRPIRAVTPEPGPEILTVARLDTTERHKGIERVLEIVPHLRQRYPTVRYVVVGRGNDQNRLQEVASKLGIADAVDFRGFVRDELLPRTYSSADVFVMPSTKEGFGFVFIEAMACGTAVIGGNRDGSVDALLDGRIGRLVDPDDATALVEAIAGELESTQDARVRAQRRADVLTVYGFDRFRQSVADVFSVGRPSG